MANNRLDISDQTAISMPMRNLISIVAAVAVGVLVVAVAGVVTITFQL